MKNIIIGLTGPTGSGKSSACVSAKELGFKTVDCDKLARVAVNKGTEGLKAVCNAFGDDILNPDGTLNRKALAKKAFVSDEKTELLNKTLLPYIVVLMEKEIDTNLVLLDAPTLYESGTDSMCDAVIAVLADEKIRLKRITTRDNIDEETACLRISAGKSDKFYIEKTPYIIYNNGNEADFKSEFKAIINKILKENGRCLRKQKQKN